MASSNDFIQTNTEKTSQKSKPQNIQRGTKSKVCARSSDIALCLMLGLVLLTAVWHAQGVIAGFQ
eukprot:19501-Heterococcus_DN1.PRE.2